MSSYFSFVYHEVPEHDRLRHGVEGATESVVRDYRSEHLAAVPVLPLETATDEQVASARLGEVIQVVVEFVAREIQVAVISCVSPVLFADLLHEPLLGSIILVRRVQR